jgi:hypothetical protein
MERWRPRHRSVRRPLVFNAGMYRSLRTVLCALAAVVLLPAAAQARVIEIGTTAEQTPPSCPGTACQAVSRTTAYQVKVGTDRKSFLVPADGLIVAWSIALGKPSAKQQKFFEGKLGGPSAAGVSVLRPVKRQRLTNRMIRQSPQKPLTPFFGSTVQFPLYAPLSVRKGDILALTVSSWAPALALGFGTDTSWRASRPEKECADFATQTAQQQLAVATQYRCLYQTARLTYSATLVTTPVASKPTTR